MQSVIVISGASLPLSVPTSIACTSVEEADKCKLLKFTFVPYVAVTWTVPVRVVLSLPAPSIVRDLSKTNF